MRYGNRKAVHHHGLGITRVSQRLAAKACTPAGGAAINGPNSRHRANGAKSARPSSLRGVRDNRRPIRNVSLAKSPPRFLRAWLSLRSAEASRV